MCEHEFRMFTNSNCFGYRSVCAKCHKTQREIDLETELAAANAKVTELDLDKTILLEILARQRMLISANVCCGCPEETRGEWLELCKNCEVNKLRNYEEKYSLDFCEQETNKRKLLFAAERTKEAESQCAEWKQKAINANNEIAFIDQTYLHCDEKLLTEGALILKSNAEMLVENRRLKEALKQLLDNMETVESKSLSVDTLAWLSLRIKEAK